MRGFRPWTVQPPDGTPIDWDNPLAQGLVDLIDLSRTPRSALLHTPPTFPTTAPKLAVPHALTGIGIDSTAAAAGISFKRTDGLYTPTALTIVAPLEVSSGTQYAVVVGVCSASNVGAGGLKIGYYQGGSTWFVSNAGFSSAVQVPKLARGTPLVLALAGDASGASIFIEGEPAYSDSTNTPVAASASQLALFVNTNANQSIAGYCGGIFFYGRRLPPAQLESVTRNPWQLYWKRRRTYSVVASSAVTAALTGVSAATASGTLGPTLSLALTGIAGTSALGTFALAISLSLTGSALTAAQGSLIAPGSTSVALTGVGATIALGSLAQGGSATLSGIAATFAAGSLAVTHSGALTGSGVTSASGTLGASLVLALSGSSAATAQGSLAPAITLALGGNLLASATGYLTAPTGVLVSDPYWSIKRPYVRAFTVSRINGRDFTAKRPYTRTFTVDSMSIQFPIKGISEKVPLTFDFTQDLPSGVTLTGTPTLTVSVTTGTDANPSDILNGSAAFNSASTAVIQGVKGGLNGVGYTITCTSPTTQSNLTLTLVGLLQVRRDPD